MAHARVRKEEVDKLLASKRLSVVGEAKWRRTSKMWCKAEVPVIVEGDDSINLKMVISVGFNALKKRDYSLLWAKDRIRGLDVNGNHTNPSEDNENWTYRTHKHSWTDIHLDQWAYTPTDITATDDDVQGQFEQFCAECKIKCQVTLPVLPSDMGGLRNDL